MTTFGHIRTAGLALVAASLFAASAFAAEFKSTYKVEGTSPDGGGAYDGTVSLKKTGEATYQVTWLIGNDKFVGTGIGGAEGLAVAYKSGSNTGIAIYRLTEGGAVEGFWTYAGGKDIGTENWK